MEFKLQLHMPPDGPPPDSLRPDRSPADQSHPILIDHGIQAHLWVHSISASVHLLLARSQASECISQFPRSRPPSASPQSLDPGLQVHLGVHLISVSKCISKYAPLRHSSASPNSHDYWPQVRTIITSRWISKLALSRPPSTFSRSDGGSTVMLG